MYIIIRYLYNIILLIIIMVWHHGCFQIRLIGGGTLTHTFQPTDTLVDVNQHILMNQSSPNTPFLLMTNFPKKVFSSSDMSKTLKELGQFLLLPYSQTLSLVETLTN